MSLPAIILMQAAEVGRLFHRDGWAYQEQLNYREGERSWEPTRKS